MGTKKKLDRHKDKLTYVRLDEEFKKRLKEMAIQQDRSLGNLLGILVKRGYEVEIYKV